MPSSSTREAAGAAPVAPAPHTSSDYTVDRSALLAQPPPRLSRKVMWTFGIALAVIGIGGGVLDNAFANPGPATKASGKPAVVKPAAQSHPLVAPLSSLLGINDLHESAPGFSLVDAAGRPVTLASFRGKVLVLSFFDARCRDICPVLAKEIAAADRDLGKKAADVQFATVNTNPLATSVSAASRTGALSGLAGLGNWRFLTGSVPALESAWNGYGVTIDVQPGTGVESHNDLLYFVTPSGQLAYLATPFASESRSGTYSLSAADVARFGRGIAQYAGRLVP